MPYCLATKYFAMRLPIVSTNNDFAKINSSTRIHHRTWRAPISSDGNPLLRLEFDLRIARWNYEKRFWSRRQASFHRFHTNKHQDARSSWQESNRFGRNPSTAKSMRNLFSIFFIDRCFSVFTIWFQLCIVICFQVCIIDQSETRILAKTIFKVCKELKMFCQWKHHAKSDFNFFPIWFQFLPISFQVFFPFGNCFTILVPIFPHLAIFSPLWFQFFPIWFQVCSYLAIFSHLVPIFHLFPCESLTLPLHSTEWLLYLINILHQFVLYNNSRYRCS